MENEKIFLSLLGSTIHPNNTNITTNIDWPAVFTFAKNHNVLPLIFEAASGYEDFVNSPNYQTYMTVSMQWIMRQTRHTEGF